MVMRLTESLKNVKNANSRRTLCYGNYAEGGDRRCKTWVDNGYIVCVKCKKYRERKKLDRILGLD